MGCNSKRDHQIRCNLSQDTQISSSWNNPSQSSQTCQQTILKVRKLFIFETAWDVLKDLDKWRQAGSKSPMANPSSQSQPAPTSNAPFSTPNLNGSSKPHSKEPPRPVGIKCAKQQAASDYAAQKKLQLLEKNAAKGQH